MPSWHLCITSSSGVCFCPNSIYHMWHAGQHAPVCLDMSNDLEYQLHNWQYLWKSAVKQGYFWRISGFLGTQLLNMWIFLLEISTKSHLTLGVCMCRVWFGRKLIDQMYPGVGRFGDLLKLINQIYPFWLFQKKIKNTANYLREKGADDVWWEKIEFSIFVIRIKITLGMMYFTTRWTWAYSQKRG